MAKKLFTTIYGRNLVGELKNIVQRPYLVVTMEDLWDKFKDEFDEDCIVHFVKTLEYDEIMKNLEALPIVIWMMKGFFDAIPKEIDEAARVDGYSWFKVFLRIDVPLAKSGLAATAVFCAINSWNEFLMALILTGRHTATMPVGIPGLLTPQGTIWGQIAAVGTIITIPVLIFAVLVQKHMIAGMTMGAVK